MNPVKSSSNHKETMKKLKAKIFQKNPSNTITGSRDTSGRCFNFCDTKTLLSLRTTSKDMSNIVNSSPRSLTHYLTINSGTILLKIRQIQQI